MAKKIASRAEDYSQWFHDIIQWAELADYAPVRGCMVMKPTGYAVWEKMQAALDTMFKKTGHQNCYFPALIPESFLQKEAEHVEGFAPELAVVTHGGGKELEEKLVLRPTSETMVWHMYKKWISSHRDLPLLYNQWGNVFRWEMRTRLFLRTMEFLWQEGHTAHATEDEARSEAQQMLEIYRSFAEDYLAIPAICGIKTAHEKFAGAVETYSIEAMMQDGKALQLGTSHYLGQNFAKAFDVKFQDSDNEMKYVYATSWGVTTRMIGALIMVHSDDQGLVLPPKIAPTAVVIVPIWKSDTDKEAIRAVGNRLVEELDCSVNFDDREEVKPGFKFNEWELKGIPVRIEYGPRDLEKNQVVIARRDTGEKEFVPLDQVATRVKVLLDEIQTGLFERAKERQDGMTHLVDDYEVFKKQLDEGGLISAHWCGDTACEQHIATETKATIRNIPRDQKKESGKCVRCGNPSDGRVLMARAY